MLEISSDMATKIYVHRDSGDCIALNIDNPETCTFGSLRKSLPASACSGSFYSALNTHIADHAKVSSYLYEYNDFYLKPSMSQPIKPPVTSPIDVSGYKSVTAYSWEDKDDGRVIVRIPFTGAKAELKTSQIACSFDTRSFQVLVNSYRGHNWRFSCPRTHAVIIPELCSFRIGSDSVVVSLSKLKAEPWHDLFKKRAIGDTDAL